MKKTSQKFMDFQSKAGFYLKQISLSSTLNKQLPKQYNSSSKNKHNASSYMNRQFSETGRKLGSLSQISANRSQNMPKNLDINLDKLKKMFPFAAYQQMDQPKLKKQVSDPTCLPVIAKSTIQHEKTFKSTFANVDESRQISTPKINTVPKNKRLSSLKQKQYEYFWTEAGILGNKRKTNQDHPVMKFDLPWGVNMIGVCDGHGVNGHFVSSFITSKLINNLNNALTSSKQPVNVKQIGERVYSETNNQLIKQSGINVSLSGSTVVTVIGYNKKIYCFNVGDSRIILVSNLGGKWTCKALSDDQKPCRKDQKERILKFGGRVESQRDQNNRPIGPMRVWMAKQQLPGLAMTRAFGDTIGIKAGVIGTPQILQLDVKPSDCFLAAASDGVWQYMSNEDVMNILIPYYEKGNLKAGCEEVVKKSMALWKKYCMSRDDITIVACDMSRFCPI